MEKNDQIKVHTYNWGPCVVKLKIRDNFKELLLNEAKKNKGDYRHKLAGQLDTEIGFRLTCPRNIVIGNNANFSRDSSLNSCNGKINIGDNISVNQNVDINSSDGGFIEMGDDVMIGNNVVIRAADHIYKNKSKKINQSGHEGGKIIIGNNVWIGANCVILKNVTIKDGSVIGAGTVVTKDVDSNELVISNKQVNLKNI